MDGEGQPCCLDEVERARNHPDFSSFIKWLHKSYYGLDQVEDYVWGDAEGDPLADMQDFAMCLVETGQGSWEADESVTYLGETPMPPDNQLGDSELCPNGPETTRAVIDNTHGFCQTEVVGTVSFSKTWQKDLEQVMVSNPDWWNCSVLGGGFLIDFVGQNELKFTPARNQFPLEVRRAIYDFEELESETEGDEPMGDHDLKDPMGDHDLKEGDHDLKDPMGDHDLMEGDHDLKDPMWDHDLQSHDLKDHVETHTGEPYAGDSAWGGFAGTGDAWGDNYGWDFREDLEGHEQEDFSDELEAIMDQAVCSLNERMNTCVDTMQIIFFIVGQCFPNPLIINNNIEHSWMVCIFVEGVVPFGNQKIIYIYIYTQLSNQGESRESDVAMVADSEEWSGPFDSY